MRLRSAVLLFPALVLLAGCAPEPAPTPTPTEISTPTETPTPTVTPTPSSTATPPADAAFTTSQLLTLCKDKISPLAPKATFYTDIATTEWLDKPSAWFVVIPKTLDGQDSVAVCGIGGTPDAPDFVLHGETLPDGVAELRDDLLNGKHDSND